MPEVENTLLNITKIQFLKSANSQKREANLCFPDIDLLGKFPSYDELNKDILKFKLSVYKPSLYVNKEFRKEYDIKYIRKKSLMINQPEKGFL